MQAEFDKELQSYFTDVEHLREPFKGWLAAPELPKRLLVIHGVGGVGKSSLLRMFRLYCKSMRVPVALASGDEQKSALDVLTRWADDLTADGVALSAFKKTLAQYRALYQKVENEAAKEVTKRTKEVARTVAETAVSMIPGFGPILAKLGGMTAEQLTDWLFSRGFKKPDVDLLLDPAKRLTEDFLADVTNAAGKRRLALMLDTFEQMEALNDWTRDVAQRLSPNALLVIAGRVVPNWDRAWPTWMANAQVEELKPMTEDHMRELVRRYYATLRGGEPDPKQVEAIIAFARGLPMVATSVVNTWVRFPDTAGNFQAAKPLVVNDFVRYLLEGVPKELVPALEAAAIVRWFDQPILRAVMQRDDVRDAYNELRRFPFVRTRVEGLALHDAVRDIIDENLRVQDAERHRELHERAAAYFEARLAKATGEEAERLGLERLYHRIRADEETGIKLFQEMAEELVRYRLVNRLRALLNDVNTYPLERENSRLWREYYKARLAELMEHLEDAEKTYHLISGNKCSELRLRGYVLSDLGSIKKATRFVMQSGGLERVVNFVLESDKILTESDPKHIQNILTLGDAYQRVGEIDKAVTHLRKAIEKYREQNDRYGVASVWRTMIGMYGRVGRWRDMFDAKSQGLSNLPSGTKTSITYADLVGHWGLAWVWAGRPREAEVNLRTSLEIRKELGVVAFYGQFRDLVLATGMQDKYGEAAQYFALADDNHRKILGREDASSLGFWAYVLLRQGDLQKSREYLSRSLEIRLVIKDRPGMPENLVWLGQLYEVWSDFAKSEDYYRDSFEYRWLGRRYFECGALTGLTRVKHAQGDYAAIPPMLAEAEQLAQQYEYNDHLASVRLTQGHIAWEGNAPSWENGFDAALRYYQHALIYALRYNRFLLDEVLSGRPQGTPLRPIIPECLKRGEEGRKMLIALRDWWQTGINDIGTPRPDTISPIPEGISLLEAERIAREREPGDGSPQKSVVEQIENALKEAVAG